jgi:DNA polymerase I-like protein with 3'-5' exonuclease and polymerase domains
MIVQPCFPSLMPESNWRPPAEFPEIWQAKAWDLDVETCDPHLQEKGPGFQRKDAFVCGVAIHVDGFSGYWPVRHAQGQNLAPNVVFSWLAEQAKQFNGEMYGANLLYDLEALHAEGVHFKDSVKIRDVQICEPLIDEESVNGYSLETLSKKYLGVGKEEGLLRESAQCFTKGYKDKRGKRPISFDPKSDLWMLPPEYVGPYAEGDVDRPHRIYEQQKKELNSQDLWQVLELEASLVPILLKMRIQGVRVDLEQAEALVRLMTREIDKYRVQIKELVGFNPNLDSSAEMLKAYNVLNFAMPELNIAANFKMTALGNPSFTSDWYRQQGDPLSLAVSKAKKLLTLRDDFVLGDIVEAQINGRIHSSFHQLRESDRGTRSGRFSSTNVNLTQVPNRHDDDLWGSESPIWAEEVRKLFVAELGQIFCKSDYSQQESRLIVHFAALCKLPGVEDAVHAFRTNPTTDFHQLTTKIVNEKSGRNFKRKQIKAINLGLSYGMGVAKLARQLNLSIPEAQEILTTYNQALPFIRALSNKAMRTAQERGYLVTLLGRRQHFNMWEPMSESKEDRGFKYKGLPLEQAQQAWPGRRLQRAGVHKSLNRLAQPGAASQTKKAVQVLYYEYGIVLGLIVHDECSSSLPSIEEARTVKRVMETCVLLEIPVVADTKIGPSWGAAKQEVRLNT